MGENVFERMNRFQRRIELERMDDHLISARRPDLVIVNEKKKICQIVDFAFLANHRVKLKESEKRTKYLDLTREMKKTMEQENDSDTNCNWCTRYSHQKISTGTVGLGNKRMNGDHPNYSIVGIGQNTKKSPGNLRRLAVTQTPEENHQLMLVGGTLK